MKMDLWGLKGVVVFFVVVGVGRGYGGWLFWGGCGVEFYFVYVYGF